MMQSGQCNKCNRKAMYDQNAAALATQGQLLCSNNSCGGKIAILSEDMTQRRTSPRIPRVNEERRRQHAATMLQEGYANFPTLELDVNDGNESCRVTLTATSQDGEKKVFVGATGNGCHAEIDALINLIRGEKIKDGHDLGIYCAEHDLVLSCPNKSCCRKCAAVMGLCGVKAETGTFKTTKDMGLSEWHMPEILRVMLDEACNIPKGSFRAWNEGM